MPGANATPNVSASAAQGFIAFSSWFRRRKKQVLCRCSNSWNFSWLVGPPAQSPALSAEGLTSAHTKTLQKFCDNTLRSAETGAILAAQTDTRKGAGAEHRSCNRCPDRVIILMGSTIKAEWLVAYSRPDGTRSILSDIAPPPFAPLSLERRKPVAGRIKRHHDAEPDHVDAEEIKPVGRGLL